MAKITLTDITSGYAVQSAANANNTAIETELNDKVLYRNNPTGQPNQMHNNLDMNSNDILNTNVTNTQELYIAGTKVNVTAFNGTNIVKYYATVANMVAATDLTIGDLIATKGYWSQDDGGHGIYRIVAAATGTDDGLIYHDLSGISGQAKLIVDNVVNVRQAGAKGDGATDDYAAIQATIDAVRNYGGKVFFPANKANTGGFTVYNHSSTLEYGAKDVILEGESTGVRLTYTGVGTGLMINLSTADPSRERCGLRNISLHSTTGARAFDWTCASYGNFENFYIAYSATNAELLYATGHDGAGPYYNQFSNFSLFGGVDRSQYGIVMKPDTSGNLSDGPNANEFSNLKRAASLYRLLDVASGTGNLFTNFGAESIKDTMVVLNNITSYADTGTSTSTTNTTLVDTSKSWSTTPGDPLNFINDTVTLTSGIPGESRRIVSNTATTLTLDKPWSKNPGNTLTYTISEGKAVKNKFVNVRQEGLASDNPDGFRFLPGARGNEVSGLDIGSLGSGTLVDDQAQEQSNKVLQGELITLQYIVENPGPSATIELVPRNSVFGGINMGSAMVIEYVEMNSPNFVAGSATATLTVDHGGAATGAGLETLTCAIDDKCLRSCYVTGSKTTRSSANAAIFASLTTNANVNPSSDFIVTLAIRVD